MAGTFFQYTPGQTPSDPRVAATARACDTLFPGVEQMLAHYGDLPTMNALLAAYMKTAIEFNRVEMARNALAMVRDALEHPENLVRPTSGTA